MWTVLPPWLGSDELLVGSSHGVRRVHEGPWAGVGVACIAPLLGILPLYALTAEVAAAGEGSAAATTLIAAAVAVFFSVAVAASIAVSHLLQQAQVRQATLSGLCATAVASALLMVSDDRSMILSAMAVAALGHALAQSSSNVIIVAATSPTQRATGLGVKQATVPGAAVLAGATLPVVIPLIGARAAFGCIALLSLAACPVVTWATNRTHSDRASHEDALAPVGRRPGRLTIVAVFAAALFASIPGNLAAVFLVPSRVAVGIDVATAGLLLVVASLAAAATRIALGIAADQDRIPINSMTLLAALLIAAAAGYLLLTQPIALPLQVVIVVVTFMAGWGWNGLFVHELIRRHSGWTYKIGGTIHAAVYLGSALSPPAFAAIVQRWSYAAAWSATSGCAVLGAGVVMTLRVRDGHAAAGDHALTRQRSTR